MGFIIQVTHRNKQHRAKNTNKNTAPVCNLLSRGILRILNFILSVYYKKSTSEIIIYFGRFGRAGKPIILAILHYKKKVHESFFKMFKYHKIKQN